VTEYVWGETPRAQQVRRYLEYLDASEAVLRTEEAKRKRAQAKCALVGHTWHYIDDHMGGAECTRCGLIDPDRIF
jgi:hypothetical protein